MFPPNSNIHCISFHCKHKQHKVRWHLLHIRFLFLFGKALVCLILRLWIMCAWNKQSRAIYVPWYIYKRLQLSQVPGKVKMHHWLLFDQSHWCFINIPMRSELMTYTLLPLSYKHNEHLPAVKVRPFPVIVIFVFMKRWPMCGQVGPYVKISNTCERFGKPYKLREGTLYLYLTKGVMDLYNETSIKDHI